MFYYVNLQKTFVKVTKNVGKDGEAKRVVKKLSLLEAYKSRVSAFSMISDFNDVLV